jgi:hypothetical protein
MFPGKLAELPMDQTMMAYQGTETDVLFGVIMES